MAQRIFSGGETVSQAFSPERDPTAESLLLERAASPKPSEVAISDASSGFVLIGPRETFLLPSPKFSVRPRSTAQGPSFVASWRRIGWMVFPGLLQFGLTGARLLATHCLLLSLRFGDFLNVVSQPSLCLCQSMVPQGLRKKARCFRFRHGFKQCFYCGDRALQWVFPSGAFFFFTFYLSSSSEPTSLQSWVYLRCRASV